MTASNSTPLTDGASAVLLASEEWAEAHHLTPLTAFVDAETAAVDYVHGEEGLLMAPTYAVPAAGPQRADARGLRLLRDPRSACVTVLTHLKAWEDEEFAIKRLGLDAPLGSIDRSRLNVNELVLGRGPPSPRPVGESSPRWPSSSGRSARRPGSPSAASCPSALPVGGVVAILEA